MKCLAHKAEAVAVCAYCGRALCSDCIRSPTAARMVCSTDCAEALVRDDRAVQMMLQQGVQGSRASAFYCYLCGGLSAVAALVAWFMLPSPFLILFTAGCALVLIVSGFWYGRIARGLARSGFAALVLLFATLSASSALSEVQSIGLTVSDLDSEVRFFTGVLPFEVVSRCEAKGKTVDDLLGLEDAPLRVAQLKLGNESITLTEHRRKGRPVPSDSRSYDHWFQHIAIVVSDTDRSLAFYRDLLGFRVAGESDNYGVEQEHLNQVFGARVHITGLRAEHGPGIEFLEYITPPGGRPLPADAQANDRVFWTTQLVVDDLAKQANDLRVAGAKLVSVPGGTLQAQTVRDPDGHALTMQSASQPIISTADK